MSSTALLNQLPSVLNKGVSGSLRCVIQFVTHEATYVMIDAEQCTVTSGTAPTADLVVTISDQNLTELLKGKLNPAIGLMLRKLKAEGDLDLGMRLTSLFNFSKL